MSENPYDIMLTAWGEGEGPAAPDDGGGGGDASYDLHIFYDNPNNPRYVYEAGYYDNNGTWTKGFQVHASSNSYSCRLLNVAKTLVNANNLPAASFLAYNYNNQPQSLILIGIAPNAATTESNLTSITIPESVLSIDYNAFNGCTSLVSVTFAEKSQLTRIGFSAFANCTSLESIAIPGSVLSIGNGAFSNCTSLMSVTVSSDVQTIGEWAFKGCTGLTSITIPDSVTSIGWGAFQGCKNLENITIPFVGQTALNQTSSSYLYRIGYIFGTSAGSASDVQEALPSNLMEITVNQSTPFLANQAFAFANTVKKIYIKLGDDIKEFCFGRAAFYGCSALQTFKLTKADGATPPTLDEFDCLSDSVFVNCYNLATIVLPHTKAFAASAYETLQIQTDPVAVNAEAPRLHATLIGKGQTVDYNIFLQVTHPTNIVIANFSIDGLYGNVTINGQTTLRQLASMSSIKTNYEKLADHISYDTLSDFVSTLSSISLVGYSSVSVLQMYYSLELTFNNGTQVNIGVQTSTCSTINVLEEDQAGNYVTSTRISYSTHGFMEQIDQLWRPMPLTAAQTLAARSDIGIQAYSISTIGGSFFAYTSVRLGVGKVSITAPQRLIHAFMRDTNENNRRLRSIVFSCTTDESEVGGFQWCSSLISANYVPIYEATGLTLANYAFSKCSSLGSFSSPYIFGIGYAAFQQCFSLTTVNLPNASSLTVRSRLAKVDDYQSAVGSSLAFYNCRVLSELTLAFNEITSIGDYAFAGCEMLQSWGGNAPYWENLKNIGYHAFLNCSKLTTVGTLNPAKLQNIYFGAFQGCSELTGIAVPKVHTEVYAKDNDNNRATLNYSNFGAFFGAAAYSANSAKVPTQLKTAVITGGTGISDQAFYDCTHLESIEIPASVTSIGDYAFYGCSKLNDIQIPNSVTSIGNYTFKLCESLTSIIIPDSVTSVGEETFYGCTGLERIAIPNNVKQIGNAAFYNCSNLASITIPSDVTSIGIGVFFSCQNLASVTILGRVTTIGRQAFYNCKKLAAITIPDSVTTIGPYAFSLCTSLSSIEIPSSVTFIDEAAFQNCVKLVRIVFAANRKSTLTLSDRAFSEIGKDDETELPLTIKVASLQDYAYCHFANAVDSLCARGTTRIIDADEKLYTHLHILPTNNYTIGNYAFYNWRPTYEVAIFAPEDPTKISFGTGSLAINGTLYWCGDNTNTAVTGNAGTSIKHNFGLNNWYGTLPPNANTAVAQWQTTDEGSLEAFQADLGYDSSFTLQGLTGKLIKSNSTEPLQFQSDDVNIVLASTCQVDFVGEITLPTNVSSVQVYTGNTIACKRRVATIGPNELSNTLTLPIGSQVAIKAADADVIHDVLLADVNTQKTITLGSHQITIKRLPET